MNLRTRVVNILTKPGEEWPVIAVEQTTAGTLYTGYIMPLAAIPAVCMFVGLAVLGSIIPLFGALGFGPAYWLASAIVSYVLGLVGVSVAALVVQQLAPSFQSEPNLLQALKLVAYALTPLWVAGVFSLIPPLGILRLLAGLYGIYLCYLGVTPLMKTPQEKVLPYMIVAAVVTIVIYAVVTWITSVVLGVFFLAGAIGR